MIKRPLRPSTARPATPSPITEPPVKETLRALARLVFAAWAVRTLALVAMFMPIQPAKAERKAPMTKAIAIIQSLCFTSVPLQARRPPAITANTESTRHSALRKARAPREIYPAISCIRASPASCRATHNALTIIIISPSNPRPGTMYMISFPIWLSVFFAGANIGLMDIR